MQDVALSLVSHTNVGKTTLARTLLRRDVGVVFDQAHVTELSEAWTLLEADGARLLLWDTPGLGDTARLLRRLQREDDPLGWFLHQVWDRVADRPLWSSQEALRNVREHADVVLYLVNAAEEPEDAGYVRLELQLLERLQRPVLLLLNQTGPGADAALLARWQQYARAFPAVRDVLSLDAFTRSWVQESVLLRRIVPLLPEERRPAMEALAAAWEQRDLATFRRCTEAAAKLLVETAADREPLPSAEPSLVDRKRATAALAERMEARLARYMELLVSAHGLDGRSAARLRERLEDVELQGSTPVSVRSGALWGGLVSGAATGLAADIATGGLSFGSGLVVGALVGALGGAGLARGARLVLARGQPAVSWSPPFLDGLLRDVLLRYLAVAQFGRGRGAYQDDVLERPDGAGPSPWIAAVQRALAPRAERVAGVLAHVAAPGRAPGLLDLVPGVGGLARKLGLGGGAAPATGPPAEGPRAPAGASAVPGGAAGVGAPGRAAPVPANGPAALPDPTLEEAARRLQRVLRETLRDLLVERHPEAVSVFAEE